MSSCSGSKTLFRRQFYFFSRLGVCESQGLYTIVRGKCLKKIQLGRNGKSGTKKQSKEKVFGDECPTDIRGVIQAGVPGQKLRAGSQTLKKKSIWVRT